MKKLRLAAYLLTSVFVLSAMFSCASETTTQGETEGDTATPEQTTEAVVDTVPKFNEGIVDYVKTEVSNVNGLFDASKIGTVVSSNDSGVLSLFYSDFEDGDPNCGGTAVSRTEGSSMVHEGKLCVPYKAGAEPPVGGGWTTWAANADADTNKYAQVQLSMDAVICSSGDGAWLTGMIGCFVSDYTFKIPDNAGDGIWISFNSISDRIYFYAADKANWAWPAANTFIQLDKGSLSGTAHIDVICTNDYSIYVYIGSELAARVSCSENNVMIFDGKGEKTYTGDFDMNSISGNHYSLFCHGDGGFAIDSMEILGCTVVEPEKEVIVVATPVGNNKLGLDITDKKDVMSICYTMWFDAIHGSGSGKVENALNVTELTEKYGFTAKDGFGEGNNHSPAFHYWGKPAQGYYRSTDTDAIRNNMTLLYDAGVDFIILDYTYASSPNYMPGSAPWESYINGPSTALLNTIMEMRSEGLGTPYVVFWMGNNNMFDYIYNNFYSVEKWKDCFVYWNDKPFIMEWTLSTTETEDFTVRAMYGLRGEASEGQWSYLEINNGKTVSYDKDGNPEHMCCCVATQETYMSLSTAHGRDGGKFWNKQWQKAFRVHPKIITMTWWNEWCAQLYYVDGIGYVFTDNFNYEYSRDIEPVEGGHGDTYYKWMCQYIADYRAGKSCPSLYND